VSNAAASEAVTAERVFTASAFGYETDKLHSTNREANKIEVFVINDLCFGK
jgi:hypothetical protein